MAGSPVHVYRSSWGDVILFDTIVFTVRSLIDLIPFPSFLLRQVPLLQTRIPHQWFAGMLADHP